MSDDVQSAAGRRAADTIVADIERQIASGTLKGSAPLPSERELMEEFGASRTVIREAITALANRGLIETKPRFRPIVRQVGYQTVIDTTGPVIRQLLHDPVGVKNLYDTRIFIERGLVRDAAEKANRSDIQALKTALQANRDAVECSDAFFRTDTAFHSVLYEIQRNPIFLAVYEGFVSWLSPQWQQMERPPEHNQINYDAHAAIYQAILERDPDAAEAALIAHLTTAWEFVRPTFGKD